MKNTNNRRTRTNNRPMTRNQEVQSDLIGRQPASSMRVNFKLSSWSW